MRRTHAVFWDVAVGSEERIASIFGVEKSAIEEPAWAAGCRRRFTQDLHSATSQKMAFFIVTAPKTSNLTMPRCCKRSFFFRFSNQNILRLLIVQMRAMRQNPHPPWFDYVNVTWRRVHVVKLLIMHFSVASLGRNILRILSSNTL
jgi:hypothetical protein